MHCCSRTRNRQTSQLFSPLGAEDWAPPLLSKTQTRKLRQRAALDSLSSVITKTVVIAKIATSSTQVSWTCMWETKHTVIRWLYVIVRMCSDCALRRVHNCRKVYLWFWDTHGHFRPKYASTLFTGWTQGNIRREHPTALDPGFLQKCDRK